MSRVLTAVLFGLGAATFVFAAPAVPEIDPGAGASALTLLGGAVLLIRHKTSKR